MEEAAVETANRAIEQWGVAGAVVLIFLACLFAAYKLMIRWMDHQQTKPDAPKVDKSTPTPGLKTLFTMRASEVKEEAKRQHDSISDRTDRLEKKTDGLRDELFRVMGDHRKALESRIEKIEGILRDKDKEDTRQDRDMMNLSGRLSRIEGVMHGASTKSGVTQYVTPSMPPTSTKD